MTEGSQGRDAWLPGVCGSGGGTQARAIVTFEGKGQGAPQGPGCGPSLALQGGVDLLLSTSLPQETVGNVWASPWLSQLEGHLWDSLSPGQGDAHFTTPRTALTTPFHSAPKYKDTGFFVGLSC